MPTPMSVYAQIAARYGVDATDDDAVDLFFEETFSRLPLSEQHAIVLELFRDG